LEMDLQSSRPAATTRWWAPRQGSPFLSAAGSALTAATHLLCQTRHPLKRVLMDPIPLAAGSTRSVYKSAGTSGLAVAQTP
jgi:hypothetical protein